MRRGRPSLSAEERRLWAEVLRSVTPLPGRKPPSVEAPVAAEPASAPSRGETGAGARGRIERRGEPNPAPRPPPLAPIESKLKRKLARGRKRPDAAIDLHGMRQHEAHGALLAFLARSQAAGHSLVLVVTGKGAPALPGLGEERGVLRRQVPHWLSLPQTRPLVLGFEEAAESRGGAGALYVRLRARRAGGRP